MSDARAARAAGQTLKLRFVKRASRADGLPCFSIIRNECYFLPHLLRHYRALGVGHFIFYDDGSDDGSREILLEEEDCTIVTSEHGFREPMWDGVPFHYHARTLIPEHFGKGGWCLVVDADEFLLLPSAFASLQALTDRLDARGDIAALAAMIDFYPRTLKQRNYDPSHGPFEGARWWFDRDVLFDRVPQSTRIEPRHAGLRFRLVRKLRDQHPERFRTLYPWGEGKIYLSHLWKVPLVRTGRGIVRRNTHSINKPIAEGIQLALAHFKFHPRTDTKIREALEWKSYAKDSIEYRMLEAAIDCLEDEDLVSENSLEFRSAASLEEAGLLFG
jgi:hypothetical protein